MPKRKANSDSTASSKKIKEDNDESPGKRKLRSSLRESSDGLHKDDMHHFVRYSE